METSSLEQAVNKEREAADKMKDKVNPPSEVGALSPQSFIVVLYSLGRFRITQRIHCALDTSYTTHHQTQGAWRLCPGALTQGAGQSLVHLGRPPLLSSLSETRPGPCSARRRCHWPRGHPAPCAGWAEAAWPLCRWLSLIWLSERFISILGKSLGYVKETSTFSPLRLFN